MIDKLFALSVNLKLLSKRLVKMQNVEFLSRYFSFSIALVFMCVISVPEVKLFRKDIFFNAYELSMSPHVIFHQYWKMYLGLQFFRSSHRDEAS
jgi:hypothetical protein